MADGQLHEGKSFPVELPGRPEFDDHPRGWNARAVFPHVHGQLRLGRCRRPQVRYQTARSPEGELSDALFFDSESHPRLVLQRPARDQVLLQATSAWLPGRYRSDVAPGLPARHKSIGSRPYPEENCMPTTIREVVQTDFEMEIQARIDAERARLRAEAGLARMREFKRPVERTFTGQERDRVTILFG